MNDTKSRNHAVPRPAIGEMSESVDHLIGMVTALTAQLAVTRERLDTVERLAEAAGLFGPETVDRFVPDDGAQQQRDAIRQTLIARIFRPIGDAAARTARALEERDR